MSAIPNPSFEGDFTFAEQEPFPLDAGGVLQPVTLRYAVYGDLERRRGQAVLACHALSGSARVADWWPGMFGCGRAFDLERQCVIGVNVLGSCYGSTGPPSLDPGTGRCYGSDFPLVTVGDMVRAQARLLDHLKVPRLAAVVGGSIGGMQALEWALRFPERVERCIAIGATPLSAMGLALNHLQRQAVRLDPGRGLALARALAMCSYKSAELFAERFARRPDRSGEDPSRSLDARYDVAGYLDHQGEIFLRRFDADSYLLLSKAMDTFDLARPVETEEAALRRISAQVLLVGISSDWLFPATEVRALAARMHAAGVDVRYAELESTHGHDAFLADTEKLAPIVGEALAESAAPASRRYA
ncbi:MAG TPA: homoserine O-acetyltransferase [Terriglobales bacterium]|jgi:homoserine O-acetyltransferase|nr:homoserine O-acetyltransferase [Terriglobales bacterium]